MRGLATAYNNLCFLSSMCIAKEKQNKKTRSVRCQFIPIFRVVCGIINQRTLDSSQHLFAATLSKALVMISRSSINYLPLLMLLYSIKDFHCTVLVAKLDKSKAAKQRNVVFCHAM